MGYRSCRSSRITFRVPGPASYIMKAESLLGGDALPIA